MGQAPRSKASLMTSEIRLVPARPYVPWPERIQAKTARKRTIAFAPPAGSRLTVTVEEAADLLGIARNTAYVAVRNGEIPSMTFQRKIVVPYQGLLDMIDAACGTIVSSLPAPHQGVDETCRTSSRSRTPRKTEP